MSVEDLKAQLEQEKQEFARKKAELREQMQRERGQEKARSRLLLDERKVLRDLADVVKGVAVDFKARRASEQNEFGLIEELTSKVHEAEERIDKLRARAGEPNEAQ